MGPSPAQTSLELVQESWRECARHLGILVAAPLTLVRPEGELLLPIFVASFGNAKGTIVFLLDSLEEEVTAASELGFYVSQVNPSGYSAYDRSRFVETLDDWGWFGTTAPPPWYCGRPWSR